MWERECREGAGSGADAVRLLVLSGVALWAGATLLLAELPALRRPPLVVRLRRHLGGPTPSIPASVLDALAALARSLGEALARSLGVGEDVERRLRRIHAPLDAGGFRVRQVGGSAAVAGVGLLVAVTLRAPPPAALLLVFGGGLLWFLVAEQRLARASAAWQRALRLELPVVAEQLGMLLGAGYSLTAAVHRIAVRGQGACARDLRRVVARTTQGLDISDALQEWADLAGVDGVERLVKVLALERETADLGRLITAEARALRRDVHRELIATVERRGQQVWVPVTVATLLPGVILIAVPFLAALRLFTR